MEIELSRQSAALFIALLMGVCIGVLYDLLRPLRRRTGRMAGALLDVLFCAASGCAVFTYAMGAGDGRLGIWELAAALIGFLLYMHTLSTLFLRVFTAMLDVLYKAASAVKEFARKLFLMTKKCLAHVREWFRKIKERLRRDRQPNEETGEGTDAK